MRHFFICLLLWGSQFCQAQNVLTHIPDNCQALVPIIAQETKSWMPSFTDTWYFGALIEHESCISLKHSKCCSPKSQLKTKREWGAGIGQITQAYNADGTVRFDTLGDLRNRYRNELKDLNWGNILERPDLQARAVILLSKSNYNQFLPVKSEIDRIRMMDSAYNGGAKAVVNARMACGLAKDCDSQIWLGNVDRYLKKSTKAIYAGRSPLDINLHHVKDVTITRRGKYEKLY